MPLTKTATDLQRDMGSVARLCHESKEPIYITRNGEAELVVMDVDAFERALDLRNAVFEREMRIYEAIERGRRELASGKGRDYAAIREDLDL